MALSVNWNTFVILVPKADLTPLGGNLFELNVDAFRKELKSIEASEEGAPFPDTHRHVTETVLSGFTYARLVEILSPYTIEFEDGQYVVQTTGANHNIADVKVANQVSLVVQNSAGLINSPDIQYSSFNGGVTIDPINGTDGTEFPIGTQRRPVKTLADAVAILSARGLENIYPVGDLTVANVDASGYRFVGRSPSANTITVNSNATVVGCEFTRCTIQGTFDGLVLMEYCVVKDIAMVEGIIEHSGIEGTITLSGGPKLTVVDCYDSLTGFGTPTIDFGGSGTALLVRRYNGGIQFQNKSGTQDVSIDGFFRLILAADYGGTGELIARGIGPPIQNLGSFANINDSSLVSLDEALGGGSSLDMRTAVRRIAVALGYDPSNPVVATKVSDTLRTIVAGPVGNRIVDAALTGDPTDTVTTQHS